MGAVVVELNYRSINALVDCSLKFEYKGLTF